MPQLECPRNVSQVFIPSVAQVLIWLKCQTDERRGAGSAELTTLNGIQKNNPALYNNIVMMGRTVIALDAFKEIIQSRQTNDTLDGEREHGAGHALALNMLIAKTIHDATPRAARNRLSREIDVLVKLQA